MTMKRASRRVARANGWNGFLLGYAQVSVTEVDAMVRKLAALVKTAV